MVKRHGRKTQNLSTQSSQTSLKLNQASSRPSIRGCPCSPQPSSSLRLCPLKHVTAICCQAHPEASRAQPHLDFSYQTLVIILATSPWKTIRLQEYFSFVKGRRQRKLPSSPRGHPPQHWPAASRGCGLCSGLTAQVCLQALQMLSRSTHSTDIIEDKRK